MRSSVFDYFDPMAEIRRVNAAIDELRGSRRFLEACVGSEALESIAGKSLARLDTDSLALDAIQDTLGGRGAMRAILSKQQEEFEQIVNPLSHELECISARISVDPAVRSAAAYAERLFKSPMVEYAREEQRRALDLLGGNRALEQIESAASSYRTVIDQARESLVAQGMNRAIDEITTHFTNIYGLDRELEQVRESMLPSFPSPDVDVLRYLDSLDVLERPSTPRTPVRKKRTATRATSPNAPTPIAAPGAFRTYAPSAAERHLFVLVRAGESMLRTHFTLVVTMHGFTANDVASELEQDTRTEVARRAAADQRDPLESLGVLLEYTDIYHVCVLICCDRFWPLFEPNVHARKPFRSLTYRFAQHRNHLFHGRTRGAPRDRVAQVRELITELAYMLAAPIDLDSEFPYDDEPPTSLH